MKSFFNLVQSVQKPGLCCRCLGCAVFCRSAGFDALRIYADGKPSYGNLENCIECGLCHAVCPAEGELDGEIKKCAGWTAPPGRILEAASLASTGSGTGPGTLADLLVHLFDCRRIDGVMAMLPGGYISLGTSREGILAAVRPIPGDAANRYRVEARGDMETLDPVSDGRLNRVALVAAPCQIRSLRKMQVLNLTPSHAVAVCVGLFCRGDADLDGCQYCSDFSSEFADISWGTPPGGNAGTSTFIARTDLGRALLNEGLGAGVIVPMPAGEKARQATDRIIKTVKSLSDEKRSRALRNRRRLKKRAVKVNI